MENLQDMNKIEQCAEEIVDYLSPYTRITEFGKINHIKRLCEIFTKHFPQPPTSTPSLDELVEKWVNWNVKAKTQQSWEASLTASHTQCAIEYNASYEEKIIALTCKQTDAKHFDSVGEMLVAQLKKDNASLVAEVERLREIIRQDGEELRERFKQMQAKDQDIRDYKNGYIDHTNALHKCEQERDQLRTQLATAEQTGYERGVRECAGVAGIAGDAGDSPHERRCKIKKAILNLLNKKGTE